MTTHYIDTVEQFKALREQLKANTAYVTSKKYGRIPVPCTTTLLVSTDLVQANSYNPNSVPKEKMKLLEQSIRDNGFCFPIVTIWDDADEKFLIIDGFHRKSMASEKWLDLDYIPVVFVEHDISKRMYATIQFNKARGVHQVDLDAEVVRSLIEQGEEDSQIAIHLGIDIDTVYRYKQLTGIAGLFQNQPWSPSWEVNADAEKPVEAEAAPISTTKEPKTSKKASPPKAPQPEKPDGPWEYGGAYKNHDMTGVIELPNDSQVMVCDLTQHMPDFMRRADTIFIDPPCSQGNLRTFHTKADQDLTYSFSDFEVKLFERIADINPKTLFLEVFKSNKDGFLARVQQMYPHVTVYQSCYYNKAQNQCWVIHASKEPFEPYPLEGMDEAKIIAWICANHEYEVIGDLCMGRGLVGRNAFKNDKPFVGTELNKKRLGVLVDELSGVLL